MRVLVVEDDEVARVVVSDIARAAGHEVLVAADGDAAWPAVLAFGVDVVVSDWHMPGMDGLELCRRIRSLDVDDYTYFILVTADEDGEHALRAVRDGVDDHLAKPLDPAALEARLIAAARVTDLHRQLAARRAELATLNTELLEAARTDALTGLFNRRRLDEDARLFDESLRRYGHRYSVALVDVDHFKAYNDRYGHPAGDEVLRVLAATLRASVREGDLVYRYGGEEFVLLFPAQGLGTATVAAERARVAVEALELPAAAGRHLTISVGVAEAADGGGLAQAVQDADIALYDAKATGRNRVRTTRPDQRSSKPVTLT